MLKSSFHALTLSTAYGMVLPGSIPSPMAAQITFPTALAVGGGGSVEPVVGPNSEFLSKLKAVLAESDKPYYDMDGLKWKEAKIENLEDYFVSYVGNVKNQHAYEVMVEVVYKTSDWENLTPELEKFRLTPGDIKTVAARYKDHCSWSCNFVKFTVTKLDGTPVTPVTPMTPSTTIEVINGNGADYRGI